MAADRAQAAAVEAREGAAAEVARARAAERAEIAGWRTDRATWIGCAGAALAAALAFLAACAVARVRSRTSRQHAADVVGLGLAVIVAGSLSALLAALLAADAWTFSWTLVLAAVANTLLWLIAALVGWWRADALSKVGRAAVPAAVLLVAAACVPVGVAAGQERPANVTLDPAVVALAAAHEDSAGMPVDVTGLQRRARRMQDRANDARRRAEWAAQVRDELYDERSSADERGAAARRSIDRWTVKLADAQEEYGDYQELLDFDDDLDLDFNADLDLGDDDPSFPTTEDFGSGGVGRDVPGRHVERLDRAPGRVLASRRGGAVAMPVWAWFAIAAGIGALMGVEVWAWLRHGVSAVAIAAAGIASLGVCLVALLVGGSIALGMVGAVSGWDPMELSGEAESGCHPSYEVACLDASASDHDCVGGTGNGPEYVGIVTVVGPDEYGLDRDGDGTGCD